MPARLRKRSLVVDGHRTSVSLEDPFWTALIDIAHRQGASANDLATSIDRVRGSGNLSSALRVFVLAAVTAEARGLPQPQPAEIFDFGKAPEAPRTGTPPAGER
jgi:predicted DNA-binding ribbon-helix-helix protein